VDQDRDELQEFFRRMNRRPTTLFFVILAIICILALLVGIIQYFIVVNLAAQG
jgi:hypothetical protein